jgi:hypothetical protein
MTADRFFLPLLSNTASGHIGVYGTQRSRTVDRDSEQWTGIVNSGQGQWTVDSGQYPFKLKNKF